MTFPSDGDRLGADAPGVAVVIPCYNAASTIERTIASIRAQGYPNTEIIVVDDGSQDDSVATVVRIAPDAVLVTGPNLGACHARNQGLQIATGDYVMFLDADDEIRGDYFRAGIALAQEHRADLIFTPLVRMSGTEVISRKSDIAADVTPEDLFESWLGGVQVNPSATLWRRAFVQEIGGWNETILINQDAEIVLRALLRSPVITVNPDGEGIYHVMNEGSLSYRKSEAKLSNYVDTLEGFLVSVEGTSFATRTLGIENTLYGVARMAMRAGWFDVGRRALSILRRKGPVQHRGSLQHRLIAGVLGLERKVRLWGS
jgi:glycosyltransferase involved in cell wall biosynthesis